MGRKFHYNQAFSGLQLQTQSLIYWDLLRLCATVCLLRQVQPGVKRLQRDADNVFVTQIKQLQGIKLSLILLHGVSAPRFLNL